MSNLNQDQIKRYTRHILLPEVGVEGQKKLLNAKVLVVGAGGLGCPISLYLAAAGVGTIGLVDFDTVDASNLQRQVLFTTEDVGKPKVEAAAKRLQALNPDVTVKTYAVALKSDNIMDILKDYDMIIDGTDNFPTRYLTNDAAVLQGKPNVYGSIFRFEGQVTVFKAPEGPCYRCLYPEPPPPGEVPSCAEGGVMGAMVGTVGAIQATEAIKLITGAGKPAIGKFVIYNSLDMNFRTLKLHKDPNCPVCGKNPTVKALIDYEQFCGMKVEETQTKEVAVGKDEITPLELKVMMDEKRDFLLLDVREPNEWDIANIKGSLLLPLSQLPQRFHELDQYRGKAIAVHCKSGVRSQKAINFLKQQGFDHLTNVAGGILGWSDQVDSSVPKY
ncbi:MAG TPA: molybdopterin-synthase adenylyltransferase MoeB [bacterium]|nr:molybdopterin-synthase adenylyltransferase MoeB [bacterium]